MRRLIIRPETCRSCQPCRASEECDRQAFLREDADDKPWIDFYRCRGRMRCVAVCPNGAIEELVQPCNGGRRMGW